MNKKTFDHFKRHVQPKLQRCFEECGEYRSIAVFSLSIFPHYSIIILFIPKMLYGKIKIQFPTLAKHLSDGEAPYTMMYIVNDSVNEDSLYSFPNSPEWLEKMCGYYPYTTLTDVVIFNDLIKLLDKAHKHNWMCGFSFHEKMYELINGSKDIYMFTIMEY